MNDPELISIPVAATMLGISQPTIRRMIRAGLMRTVRIGGSVRIDGRKLRQWLDAGGSAYPTRRTSAPSAIQSTTERPG